MAPIEELPIDAVFSLTRQPTKKSQLAPWQAFRADELVGMYEVGNLIGKGGQGSVYAVKKSEGHCVRALAFKTAKIASLGARTLEGEFEAYGRIGPHENLVEVFGLVSQSGIAGLVMERADTSLKALLDRNHRAQILTSLDICGLVLDVAHGLQHLHSKGWWHNDVKPGNILVFSRPDGGFTAKLVDFGLATPEAHHPFQGTLSLNPPEAMRRYRQSRLLIDEFRDLELRIKKALKDERLRAQQVLRAALRSSGLVVDHETAEWKAVFKEESARAERIARDTLDALQTATHLGAADDEYECNAYGKDHDAQKAVLGLRDAWGLGVILLYALTGRYPTDSLYIPVVDLTDRKLEQFSLWARDLERATPSWLEKEPQLLESPFSALLRGMLCPMKARLSLDKIVRDLDGLQDDLRDQSEPNPMNSSALRLRARRLSAHESQLRETDEVKEGGRPFGGEEASSTDRRFDADQEGEARVILEEEEEEEEVLGGDADEVESGAALEGAGQVQGKDNPLDGLHGPPAAPAPRPVRFLWPDQVGPNDGPLLAREKLLGAAKYGNRSLDKAKYQCSSCLASGTSTAGHGRTALMNHLQKYHADDSGAVVGHVERGPRKPGL